jgi:hypothetical protein
MADENELRELCERIARLSDRDQTRLLEMVLVENRRQYEELRAEALAADAALRELEKQHGRVVAPAPFTFPPETKREAG